MTPKIKWKMFCLGLATLLLGLTLNISVAQAQTSENYNVMLNTWAGGNYGGKSLDSASYQLVLSSGPAIKINSSSAGYELCSGYICQANRSFLQMRLPAVVKSAE